MRILLVAAMVLTSFGFAIGEQPTGRFDGYSDQERAYLKRLNGQPGALAYTPEYPGGFEAWQAAARAKLKDLIGFNRIAAHAAGHLPTVQLERETLVDGHWRQLGRIETEPGITIPFWILRPMAAGNQNLPVVICAHGHDADGWNTYAGVYKDKEHQTAT